MSSNSWWLSLNIFYSMNLIKMPAFVIEVLSCPCVVVLEEFKISEYSNEYFISDAQYLFSSATGVNPSQ